MKTSAVSGMLTLALTSSLWAANPFVEFQKATPTQSSTYFRQTPPFKYPFPQSEKVQNSDFDFQKFLNLHPTDTLNQLSKLYAGIPFSNEHTLYRYPFAIHPDWEYLPYPFVKDIPESEPSQWIKEFDRELKTNEGIRSLKFHQELDGLTNTKAYSGNELKLLKTPDSYAEILKRLEKTKNHAFISTYLFNCDKGTRNLVELIGKKASQGINVFVMYDALGAKSDPKCGKTLTKLGAKIMPLQAGIGHVFHEKMYVFDGEYAIIDGQNLIAAGTLSNGVNNLFNDVAVGVKGPIATKVGERFIQLWESQKQVFPQTIKAQYQTKKIEAFVVKNSITDGTCRVVSKNPGKDQPQINNLYMHTVKNSKNYLFFNYIDPQYRKPRGDGVGEKFLDAVIKTANSNTMRVDMLTNGWKDPFKYELPKGDTPGKNVITRAFLGLLDFFTKDPHKDIPVLRKNLMNQVYPDDFHLWSYAQYMHAKTLMSDNVWTIIGSYNMNSGSENKSYEMVVACFDKKLAEEYQKSVIVDLLNSIPVPLQSY